jgi:dTDP-4-amino-4,6-dideoxygalactose transaminase
LQFIPLLRPLLPTADAVLPFLRRIDQTRQYTNFGPLHNEFLQRLVALQRKLEGSSVHGVLTSNATLGLELSLASLDLPLGSRVAVPALTFPATATAVLRCGHVPVALDVDSDTWLLTPDSLPKDFQSSEIAAVIPVATFGMPQDAEHWSRWSQTHQTPVIIDAAAAFGAQKAATGVPVVFSLHATKTLSSGEGGAVLTRDPSQASRLRTMTNFGIGYDASRIAGNAKLSEYHAAVGLAHLNEWPTQVSARRKLLLAYQEALSGLVIMQKNSGLFAPSVMPVRMRTSQMRNALEAACAEMGIQTRRWYQPLVHEHPSLVGVETWQPLEQAEDLARTLIGLPFFPDMSSHQLAKIKEVVKNVVTGNQT